MKLIRLNNNNRVCFSKLSNRCVISNKINHFCKNIFEKRFFVIKYNLYWLIVKKYFVKIDEKREECYTQ